MCHISASVGVIVYVGDVVAVFLLAHRMCVCVDDMHVAVHIFAYNPHVHTPPTERAFRTIIRTYQRWHALLPPTPPPH